MKCLFTKERAGAMRRAEICRLRAAGCTLDAIARLTGWTYPTIRMELREAGVEIGPPGVKRGTRFRSHKLRKVEPAQIPALLAMVDAGETYVTIGQRFGISWQRAAQIAREHGRQPRKAANGKAHTL